MTTIRERRLHAAEEVCWSLHLAVELGFLPRLDAHTREWLGVPMLTWLDVVTDAGRFHTRDVVTEFELGARVAELLCQYEGGVLT